MQNPGERFPLPEAVPQPVQPEIDRERHGVPAPVVDGALRRIKNIEQELDEDRAPKGPTIH